MRKITFLLLLCSWHLQSQSCADFFGNLDVQGSSPNPTSIFSNTTAPYCGTTGEYPSPQTAGEMSATPFSTISCPAETNTFRGLDASYQVVVGGDFIVPNTGGAEVEGRLAVGGNVVIDKTYGIGESGGGTFVISAEGNAVAVEGTISGTGTLNMGSNNIGGAYQAYSGGASTLVIGNGAANQNNGSSIVDHASLLSQAASVSTQMQMATATATWNYAFSVGTITGTNAAVEVVNIPAADLANVGGEIRFANIAPGAVIVCNVAGTSINKGLIARAGRVGDPIYTASSSDSDALIFNLVWNFHEATSLTTASDLNGLVLLPNGNLTLNNNLNGRAYVGGNLTHAGAGSEIHNYPFLGNLAPFCPGCGLPSCRTVTVLKN